ncbi:hypothetical protein AB836_00990 [Rickettsiales bacterium (ex Bugula neritina AB1)]|nr:hypothetical protein AB836_00990 [Rickettsiales bacterium (ex Bugula neritina AB1)]
MLYLLIISLNLLKCSFAYTIKKISPQLKKDEVFENQLKKIQYLYKDIDNNNRKFYHKGMDNKKKFYNNNICCDIKYNLTILKYLIFLTILVFTFFNFNYFIIIFCLINCLFILHLLIIYIKKKNINILLLIFWQILCFFGIFFLWFSYIIIPINILLVLVFKNLSFFLKIKKIILTKLKLIYKILL